MRRKKWPVTIPTDLFGHKNVSSIGTRNSVEGVPGGGGEGRVKYVAILHMIRKPNSIIVLLFIQNNS